MKVNQQPTHLKAGTKITCPKCSDLIGTVLIDILPGATIHPSHLVFEQLGHKLGSGMACKKCGAAFGRSVVHTAEGWV